MTEEAPQGLKPPSPQDFAQTAAQADGYEIAAAHTALAQSREARVLAFARFSYAEMNRIIPIRPQLVQSGNE